MAIPSINDLIRYTVTKLMGANINSNFSKIVEWLTNSQADVSFKTINTSDSVNIGGSLSIGGDLTIAGASIIVPVGTIILYSASIPPNGYILCDGSAISRITYYDLFILIGETFGAGDGTTTFNLPNITAVVTDVNYIIKY